MLKLSPRSHGIAGSFAGSGPSNRVGTDCCAVRSDSGMSPDVYLGVLGACHEKDIN
jgi:hypothetical protein